jgi:hypothetical protein
MITSVPPAFVAITSAMLIIAGIYTLAKCIINWRK